MDDSKLKLTFENYEIELSNDKDFKLNSADNSFKYDFTYHDEEALNYQCSQHAIRVFASGQLYKSAIVCAIAGGTTIHSQTAIVDNNDIFICCANKVFSLSLPDLKLNWITEVDMATCFGIYKADNGLFTHGEMTVKRLDHSGQIIWDIGLRDIIVNFEENREQEEFVLRDNYISLMDFNNNKYQLGFDGKFISEQLSEQQKRWDLIDKKRKQKNEKPWWKFWA
ncbi:hypothetical protein SAMN05444377_1282 [Flavobacterium fontis]|uniref:Uncharacterized protein n=1 Tax=Flavobacterium fontis TaxID=1124188 RepID=A0A1M5F341_9FLAO|nr:hypothetical protein [Flavobacterium fontis]SHF85943.1 hypothetical protein SAMN05444377_1282 [Flavobacterium fontis]